MKKIIIKRFKKEINFLGNFKNIFKRKNNDLEKIIVKYDYNIFGKL